MRSVPIIGKDQSVYQYFLYLFVFDRWRSELIWTRMISEKNNVRIRRWSTFDRARVSSVQTTLIRFIVIDVRNDWRQQTNQTDEECERHFCSLVWRASSRSAASSPCSSSDDRKHKRIYSKIRPFPFVRVTSFGPSNKSKFHRESNRCRKKNSKRSQRNRSIFICMYRESFFFLLSFRWHEQTQSDPLKKRSSNLSFFSFLSFFLSFLDIYHRRNWMCKGDLRDRRRAHQETLISSRKHTSSSSTEEEEDKSKCKETEEEQKRKQIHFQSYVNVR